MYVSTLTTDSSPRIAAFPSAHRSLAAVSISSLCPPAAGAAAPPALPPPAAPASAALASASPPPSRAATSRSCVRRSSLTSARSPFGTAATTARHAVNSLRLTPPATAPSATAVLRSAVSCSAARTILHAPRAPLAQAVLRLKNVPSAITPSAFLTSSPSLFVPATAALPSIASRTSVQSAQRASTFADFIAAAISPLARCTLHSPQSKSTCRGRILEPPVILPSSSLGILVGCF